MWNRRIYGIVFRRVSGRENVKSLNITLRKLSNLCYAIKRMKGIPPYGKASIDTVTGVEFPSGNVTVPLLGFKSSDIRLELWVVLMISQVTCNNKIIICISYSLHVPSRDV